MTVADKLNNKNFREDLEDNVSLINLNIDLLISIVEDINLFNKPFSEFKEIYNYKLEQYKYEMIFIEDSVEKFQGFFTSKIKIKSDATHINNQDVEEMLKYSKDEIIFKSYNWVFDKKGINAKKEILIKVLTNRNVFTVKNKYSL